MLPHQLRCHIARGSAEYSKFLSIAAEGRKPKVNDFDHICFFFYQNVVKFDISVSDTFVMKVVKRFNDLFVKPSTDGFLDLPVGTLLFDVLVERYALDVVSNNADGFTSFNQVVHFDDVWVVDLLQSHDLPLNCFTFH